MELKFEEALEKMEEIVEKLEKGGTTLEESIQLFQEGINLTKICQEKLQDVEKQIEVISVKNGEFDIKEMKIKEE